MRTVFAIIPIVLLLGAAPLPQEVNPVNPSTSSLRIIHDIDPALPRDALYKEFHLLEDLGEFFVALPAESDKAAVGKWNLASKLISLPEDESELYVVSLKETTATQIAVRSQLLHAGRTVALVAAQADEAASLERAVPHYGLEKGVRPLNLERVLTAHPFVAPEGSASGSRAPDPRVQAMVAQVDAANLESVVQDLEDMGQRRAGSGDFVAEAYLVDSFNAIGGLTVSTHHYTASYADNVIAELPGQVEPSVIIVVGGHYDSSSYSGSAPGADDNASGTSSVREIARILSQYDFKYTLRFIAFSAEELGLIGSDAYCDLLVSQNANVIAMINLDMTAYRASGDTPSVDFVTNYSSSSLINFCTGMYNTYVPLLTVNQGSFSGGTSDHQSFTQHGYPACFPFEDLGQYSPYIHTSSDLVGISANDFGLSRMITQGALAAAATLAAPLDLEIHHTPLADTTDGSGPYTVDVEVSSLIGSTVTQVNLHYDLGSGFVTKQMAYTGDGDLFISSIPGLENSGYVYYYIDAVDDQGYTERLPDGLGASEFEFFVGYVNDIFADDFEISDNGWTHGGTGQDDWMRDVPTGNGGYDPGFAVSGDKIWGNDLGPSGYNGNYQPDVDNWLESPSIDCSGETGVQLRYRRWLTVQQAASDQARIKVNGNTVYENPLVGNLIDTEWVLHEVDISAYADNNPDVKVRFTLTTNSTIEMGGWNIDDLHVGTVNDGDLAELSASEVYLPISTGGSIDFSLNGPGSVGGRTYVLLASASGTSPGTPIGSVVLPLNWDIITKLTIQNLNSWFFTDFTGTLDGAGDGAALLNFPPVTTPTVVGVELNFAWLTLYPIDYASNPVGVLLVP